jgi:hypothetical protein
MIITNSSNKGKTEKEYVFTFQNDTSEYNFVQSTDSNKKNTYHRIPSDTYKLYFLGKYIEDIKLEQNKIHIIRAYNNLTTLGFGIIKNPNLILYKLVKIVNLATPLDTIFQYTDYPYAYPKGHYYIGICTTPISKFKIELNDSSDYEIQIPESCLLLTENVEKYTNVELYQNYENNQEKVMSINENYTNKNPLEIQYGSYKITWTVGNDKKEKTFFIPEKTKFTFKF